MPVSVKKLKGKYRVVEKATGRPVKNEAGTAADGGGHETAEHAMAQAEAINIHQHYHGKKR